MNNQHHDQPLLTNYFLASSPLSSSSSLSESNTLIGESGLNSHGSSRHGSTASSPTGHVSNHPSSASLPHKLRHKLQQTSSSHSHRGNECENAVIENGPSSVVMRGQVLTSTNSLRRREEREEESGKEQLKEENYTLRNELQRLATEVASLRTILLPDGSFTNGQQQQQQEFSSSPSHQHNNDQAHDEEGPQDQDMDTSSEKGSSCALDD